LGGVTDPEGDGHGTGKGHSPELPEFKEHWDTTLRQRVCVLGSPVQNLELDSMIPVVPFQLGIVCDSKYNNWFRNVLRGGKLGDIEHDKSFVCSAEIVQIWDQVSLDVQRQLALSKVIFVPCVPSHTLVVW